MSKSLFRECLTELFSVPFFYLCLIGLFISLLMAQAQEPVTKYVKTTVEIPTGKSDQMATPRMPLAVQEYNSYMGDHPVMPNGVWIVNHEGECVAFVERHYATYAIESFSRHDEKGEKVTTSVDWTTMTPFVIVDSLERDHGTIEFVPLFRMATRLE